MARHFQKFKDKINSDEDFKGNKLLASLVKQLETLIASQDNKKAKISDDDIEGSDAHQTVSDGMMFSVPSDIYSQIAAEQRNRFISLGKTVVDLRLFMQNLSEDFTATKPRKSAEEKDGDFELDQ